MAFKKEIDIDKADPKQMEKINTIAKVSAQLFAKKSYRETSMDEVAMAAKLTKGGVYYYFPSKNEILYFICSTYINLDLEGLEESLSGLRESDEKIKFIVFRHIDHYITHVDSAKTLLNEAFNLPPKYLREVRAMERHYFEIVSGVISDLLGAKSNKNLVTTLAFTLFGMLNWIYAWYDPKGSMKPKELSQLIYEVFTNGIKNSILK